MINGYTPLEPKGQSAFHDWAEKTHRAVFQQRRQLYTPNSLTTQTPWGVFHRPKPTKSSGGGGDLPVWL